MAVLRLFTVLKQMNWKFTCKAELVRWIGTLNSINYSNDNEIYILMNSLWFSVPFLW